MDQQQQQKKRLKDNYAKKAIKVFDDILMYEPFHFNAIYGKGLAFYNIGLFEESLEWFDNAIKTSDVEEQNSLKIWQFKVKAERKILAGIAKAEGKFERPIDHHHHLVMEMEMDESFDCGYCGRSFNRKFTLNRHLSIHLGIKPHQCVDCKKRFIQKGDLLRHEKIHRTAAIHECPECFRVFKVKKYLTTHMVTHSENRPYKCRHCPKAFKVKRLWQYHEGLHADVKPFNCDVCGRGFPARAHIISHLKTHCDDRPYQCSKCSSSFKRNYDLQFHIKGQHSSEMKNKKK
jgi:uncharacterized Zn-finger protein